MSQSLEDYAKEKKIKPGQLLRKNLGREQKEMMRPATHIGKYTHPQAEDSMSILCENTACKSGYVCFGNFKTNLHDYVGNAAYLPHSKTLEALMEDGKTVREHLVEQSAELKSVAAVNEEDLSKWKNKFQDKEKQAKSCIQSNFKLKQIYFPLENHEYRLMTLLPCSLLVWELKSRARDREWETRTEKGKEINTPKAFIEQWIRKYGGTKTQNVGHLNNENGGNARVLTCLPPNFKQDYQLPQKNFFNQIKIYIPKNSREAQRGVWQLFQSLYNTLQSDPNALWARRKKRGILRSIIERGIIMPAENIRENASPGWSNDGKYSSLPAAQKAWLDPYAPFEEEQRDKQKDWPEEIALQISRFIRSNFERMVRFDQQKKQMVFDEAFSKEISDLAKEYLDE